MSKMSDGPKLCKKGFRRLKMEIRKSISAAEYQTWIEPIEFVLAESGNLVVLLPNQFAKSWVKFKYGASISNAAKRIFSVKRDVRWNSRFET
jgi:chromosomal replication initiation ATPase DnaA